jgi:hypothetical protein
VTFFSTSTFKKPKARSKPKKAVKKIGRKGEFWAFCNQILTLFFLQIGLAKVCESCHGAGYCGPLTPAHSRRRNGIRVGDWYYALRVACLGSYCHFDIDSQGGPAAEPIIEGIITKRFKAMGLTEDDVKRILLECAAEIQKDNEKYQHFLVILD